MSHFRSDFLHILSQRGFIHQTSDDQGLDKLFLEKTTSAYIGFDPTAPSLHAGSLIQIMMLYWLQQTGHRPIALMGGGTGLIGDPSFKDEARKLLDVDTIKKNIDSIHTIFNRYLRFDESSTSACIVNNADWLEKIEYLAFLRDIGKYFSINRMLSFESVKRRLDRESSLSFLEFNYMILQAYDFTVLNKNYDVRLQMGGSDQWGNIINGIELAHRLNLPQLYGLTSPLLTTASGAKMGKSLNGAIWLNETMLSAYEFWQYWRNTEDADVVRFLKLYTALPLDEIDRLAKLKGRELNDVKKILATEITKLLHGEEAAQLAAKTAEETFEQGKLGAGLPQIIIEASALEQSLGILSLLVQAGLAKSTSEARRHINGGGVRLNDAVVQQENYLLNISDFEQENTAKLSVGKKRHVLIKLQ